MSLEQNNSLFTADTLVQTYNKVADNINKRNLNPRDKKKYLEALTDPEDIVVLYNLDGSPQQVAYGEFLTSQELVPKLINKDSFKIYKSKNELKAGKEYSVLLEPAKIVVAYDLLGNIVNTGIELSESDQLQTTSDAIFDSEQTVIDNIIRTKIIKQDTEHVYYLDDSGRYNLIENQVHQIYKLNLDDKDYYYRSHQELMTNLKQYILLHSEKVGIK